MHSSFRRRPYRAAAAVLALALAGTACGASTAKAKPGSLAKAGSLKGATFTVGSKEFTEQLILCHITSLALRSAGATAKEKCGLSGSNTVRKALTAGSIDMYWEYTGTGWISYLKHTKPITDPAKQYQAVAKEDLAKNNIKWLKPAPLNNTYAIAVKAATAKKLGVTTMSDYAKLVKSNPGKSSMCVASEFAGRNDGLPGLEKAYGFKVSSGNLATLGEGAIYNAIGKGNPCNFGEVFTTDGRIKGLRLTVLTDNLHFFPVYNASVTIRKSVYDAHPAVAKVLGPIAKALTTPTMQRLNTDVDIKGQEPEAVAKTWMQSKNFIGK